MTAKQYLRQVRLLDKQIDYKLEELCKLKSRACSVTASYNMQPRSGPVSQDKMANIVAKIADLEKEIENEIDMFYDTKQEVNQNISLLSDPTYQLLLNLRYINQLSWQKISVKMSYDKSWIIRLHQRALAELSGILKQNEPKRSVRVIVDVEELNGIQKQNESKVETRD